MDESNSAPIWIDGQLLPADQTSAGLDTHALHYGTGVFEGIRAYSTPAGVRILRLDEHVERLIRSASAYSMQLPYDHSQICAAIIETVRASGLDGCYIRPIAWRGEGPLGVNPVGSPVRLAIMALDWGAYLGDRAKREGATAIISSWQRFSPKAIPTSAKGTGQYLNGVLAKLEATERGVDEAIMLTGEGLVAEATGANVFALIDGALVTPRETDSILPGITRASVLEMCEHIGIECIERALTVAELKSADEVMVTGTAMEITPIRRIDDQDYGPPGEITRHLSQMFARVTQGAEPAFVHWLTPLDA